MFYANCIYEHPKQCDSINIQNTNHKLNFFDYHNYKDFSTDLEVIYNAVINHDLYKNVSREQVRKYYNLNESEN